MQNVHRFLKVWLPAHLHIWPIIKQSTHTCWGVIISLTVTELVTLTTSLPLRPEAHLQPPNLDTTHWVSSYNRRILYLKTLWALFEDLKGETWVQSVWASCRVCEVEELWRRSVSVEERMLWWGSKSHPALQLGPPQARCTSVFDLMSPCVKCAFDLIHNPAAAGRPASHTAAARIHRQSYNHTYTHLRTNSALIMIQLHCV